MNNIPCELIRDLFPSYIDKLTSDASNRIIKEHIGECSECNDILEKMRSGVEEPHIATDSEKKELNFLKKNKNRNRKVVIGSIMAAVVLIVVIIAARFYMIGDYVYGNEIKASVMVDAGKVIVDGKLEDKTRKVSSVIFDENDGKVTIKIKAALTGPFSSGDEEFHSEYQVSSDVKDIYINDLIVWSDGETIPEFTAKAIGTAHEYIGDMPANSLTAETLGLSIKLGEYDNRLITDKEPYGWVINLKDTFPEKSSNDRMRMEKYMESFASAVFALTGNLGEVIYEYDTVDDGHVSRKYTREEISKKFDTDLNECRTNAKMLNELFVKTGLV